MDDDDDGRKRDKEGDREAAGRSVGRTNERTRDERGASAHKIGPRGRRSGGLTDEEKERTEKEGERERLRGGDGARGWREGGRSEVSRDDAVVRLQGRRKEEPRREPVPVTGPPAGRRTRHTAPYRPLLSHSLPSPLYALRPPRPRCVTSLRTSSLLLAIGDSRVAFKFFKQCQLVPRIPGRADNVVAP